MGYRREFRPFLFLALCVFCFALPGQSASPQNGVVWFADHDALKAIDPETNALARIVDLTTKPDALAVDRESGDVWVLLNRHLVRLSTAGARLMDIDVSRLRPDIDHPEHLVLNPYDGTVWVGGGREVIKFSATGQPLAYWRAPKRIEGLALDIDESLWVLADRELHHLSADGTLLASLSLETRLFGTERLAIDGLGGTLWIADVRRLLRLNLGQVAISPGEFAVPSLADDQPETADGADEQTLYLARALAVHPVFGTLWVATFKHLRLFDRAGNHLKTVRLPEGIGIANSMAFDSRGLSLWIGGSHGLARFSGNGDLAATIPFVDHEADHVSVAGFTLLPEVSIQEPTDGSLTSDPRPRIRLMLGATCSGTPCLLPNSYTNSLHLNVMLNGEAIGPLFQVTGSEAIYDPPARLAEGANTLIAGGVDLFGHGSGESTSRFTVDTIAPKFRSISPADGSTQSNAAIAISGQVDDPSANVLLVDSSGQAISMTSGGSFSFSVILKAGLNTFSLIARDPAGNETNVALRLAYNPVRVKITSPSAGAILNSRGAIVSGDFFGPANTGITVNGALAQVLGTRFYVNLSLPLGPNTLTAAATTPSGVQVTDTVTITVDAPVTAPAETVVEPQSGVAPLTVRVTASSNGGKLITELRLDANGDGTSEVVKSNPIDPVEYVYNTPGVYHAKITVTDSAGAVSEQTLAIVVYDGQQMDQLFTALWGGMNDALVRGDMATAVSFLNEAAKNKYQPVFEVLKNEFPQIIASYSPLRRVSVSADIGEYAIVRPNNGQNELYLIYFLRDADGVWRVDGM